MAHIATRTSSKALAAGDLTLTVASGAPITIFGIWLANRAGATKAFTIKNGSGTTLIVVEVLDATTLELSTQWLADAGLQITGEADCSVLVHHDSPGK